MIIPSHVQRMQAEAAELGAKLKALREFTMLDPKFKTLHMHDQMLMRAQRKAMAEYFGILQHRIERAANERT